MTRRSETNLFGPKSAGTLCFALACATGGLACSDAPSLDGGLVGADRPEAQFAFLDETPKFPAGEAFVDKAAAPTTLDGEAASTCGPRTGRNAQGECEFLSVRDASHVQQVLLPSGRFVMGMLPLRHDGAPARSIPAVRWPSQPPRHVDIDSYWIDLHEVRRDAYESCVAAGNCTPARCADGSDGRPSRDFDDKLVARLPQTCVSYSQAKGFCEAQGGRLPTQAEYEYAARGPDARTHPWGNEVRDELGSALVPVGARVDTSYFSLLGLGSSGAEWTQDRYEADGALEAFVAGSFRDPNGPVAREWAAWWERHRCADEAACAGMSGPPPRRVIKGPIPGRTRAAYEQEIVTASDGEPATMSLEGWAEVATNPALGFRCAGDREPSDPLLTLPAAPPEIPYTAAHDSLEVFGAVAEAVSKAEAISFCEQLEAPDATGNPQSDWRLPTGAQLLRLAPVFRGPGPFWTSDGAMLQEGAGWLEIEAKIDEALIARCIRG